MFSFFLRSKLVATNLLQFIKFLSRTQSLFFKGENRKLSPGAVRLYYVRSEPGVHIHTPAGRIYRTMQPAAYQRIVTPYMPGRAKAAKKPDIKKSARQTCLTDFFCTPRRAIPSGALIIRFVYRPAAKLRTRNLAPVLSHTWRDFSISSGEITSTTVIRTSGQCATHSRVNCSMASNALPP